MISVYKERSSKICFICLGNERLPIGKRVYSFHTPGDLSKHFRVGKAARLIENLDADTEN
jgi:hypothetical protein